MAAPTIYRSTDASAPSLTGQAGSLLTVLDAILVNGYGAKAAAGWNKNSLANASNRGAYKQGSSGGGTPGILSVDDNAPSSGRDARIRGFETLTAVTPTGTGQFPTGAEVGGQTQSNGYFVARKSAGADATVRAWVCIADDRSFHFFVQTGDIAGQYCTFHYGDLVSFSTTNVYRQVIGGRIGEAAGITGAGNSWLENANAANQNAGGIFYAGQEAGRNWQDAYGPWNLLRLGIGTSIFNNPYTGIGGLNPADSKIYLSRIIAAELNSTLATGQQYGVRGYYRGIYQLLNGGTGIADGDTFSGAGDFAGRQFLVVGPILGGAMIAVETTAWDV